MHMIRHITVLLLFMACLSQAHAQKIIDPELRTLFAPAKPGLHNHSSVLKDASNEAELALGAAFYVYKTFISSQDMPSCIFSPSCSQYAVDAFQNKGLITGWLATFDRLSRCHGLANPAHYIMSPNKKLFYDPVH